MGFDYVKIIVNFLNNTQGYIDKVQARFMLLQMFGIDIEEGDFDRIINQNILDDISKSVENDDYKWFVCEMLKLKYIVEKEGLYESI